MVVVLVTSRRLASGVRFPSSVCLLSRRQGSVTANRGEHALSDAILRGIAGVLDSETGAGHWDDLGKSPSLGRRSQRERETAVSVEEGANLEESPGRRYRKAGAHTVCEPRDAYPTGSPRELVAASCHC
jgi:hypothetical protein